MNIKWCISDIDGTLMTSQRQLEKKLTDAIGDYISRGGVFVLATGRSMLTARDVVEKIGVPLPVISCNGGVIHDSAGNMILSKKIGADAAGGVVEYALEKKFDFVAFTEKTVWHPHDSVRVKYFREKMPQIPLYGFSRADELPAREIIKFFLWNMDAETIKNFELNCNSEGKINCVQSVRSTLDVDPAGATKGNGVRFLARHFGFSTDEAAAFGDNMNDKDMLQSVGYPVAVENAEEELKRVAKRVCPSNDECGVAVVLNEIMGGKIRL